MHELFYCSFAVRDMSDADILDLLEVARSFNSENEITGILIYWIKTRQFMQILEGEKEAIFNLLEKIKKDKRHTGINLIYDGEIPDRTFGHWSMGFRNFTEIDRSKLEGFSEYLEKGFTDELIKKDPSTATNLFQIFKEVLP
jgi:hypothetical protein